MQGSRVPFWDWGLGPLELGKIAAFCLKLGKNNKKYYDIHIHVSFKMFKCTCIFIHTVLLEIHVRFHVLFYSNLSFFLHFWSFFSQGVKLGKLGVWIGKKRYYFALGMVLYYWVCAMFILYNVILHSYRLQFCDNRIFLPDKVIRGIKLTFKSIYVKHIFWTLKLIIFRNTTLITCLFTWKMSYFSSS